MGEQSIEYSIDVRQYWCDIRAALRSDEEIERIGDKLSLSIRQRILLLNNRFDAVLLGLENEKEDFNPEKFLRSMKTELAKDLAVYCGFDKEESSGAFSLAVTFLTIQDREDLIKAFGEGKITLSQLEDMLYALTEDSDILKRFNDASNAMIAGTPMEIAFTKYKVDEI